MHQVDLDLSLTEITKVEGAASLDVKVRGSKVVHARFSVTEYKRFYTQAMRGKPIVALPQLLARICGTCSNAHLLCSIKACENALGIKPSDQTKTLKRLTINGLMIRDHALHLYLFALPDLFGKDNFLSFDESDPVQHQLLHDGFQVKGAGNALQVAIAGRSVHAPNPTIGGFLKVPTREEVKAVRDQLLAARPAVLRLIDTYRTCPFSFDRKTHFMALAGSPFGFLDGEIRTDDGLRIPESEFRRHLERVVLPYSQASGYTYRGTSYMVGALARLNLAKEALHPNTKRDASEALAAFPSTNIYHNNLAQAIEVLHCLDESVDLLEKAEFIPEKPLRPTYRDGVGVGVIEAPRGTLYHKVEVDKTGKVVRGEIVVPTGQNQVNIEADLGRRVEELLPDTPKETIQLELEKLVRAYDPCMSCASHFLKVRWL